MTETIRAPWTSEQVTALNLFQQQGGVHPFTCGAHVGSSPVLDATHAGWICPDQDCAYTQDWAHAFMADPAAWPKPFPRIGTPSDEPARTTPNNPPRLFVLWLDAVDGTVATHDGVQWPDGSATLHHRHFGYTTTASSPEAACQLTFGKQGRIEWADPEVTAEEREEASAYQRMLDTPPSPAVGAAIRARLESGDVPTRRVRPRPAPELTATEATDDTELTAEEARALVDELGTDLYRAQDALAFVAECCDIADRKGRPVTTTDVRTWLKGARCGRQLAVEEPALYDKIAGMFSGPLPPPGDQPPATVLPCNHAQLRQPHDPHRWEPQPGMRPLQCPGYAWVPVDTEEPDRPA